jgi:hypothetical protein
MGKKATNTSKINPVRARFESEVDPEMEALVASVGSLKEQPKRATPAPTATSEVEETTQAGSEPAANGAASNAAAAARRPKISPAAMTVNRKILFAQEEATRNEELLQRMATYFGGKVNFSQVGRSLFSVLLGCEDAMRELGRKRTKRAYPSTGDAIGMAEYEEAVSEFIEMAIRRSKS